MEAENPWKFMSQITLTMQQDPDSDEMEDRAQHPGLSGLFRHTHTHTKITCASEKCQVWPRTTSGPASTVTVRQPSDFNRARGPGDLLAVQAPEPRRRLALWSCNQVLLVMLAWQSYRTGLNLRWPRQDRILLGKRNKAWDKYRKNKNLSHSGD